jgi:ferrochelatase
MTDSNINQAVILMNLGSPDSTEVPDVRRYLNEFLMDERVIDYPYLLRLLLVKGIIVPLRAPNSAEAYKSIWTEDGSPLVHITKQLQQAVQEESPLPVAIAMRYGSPSPLDAYKELAARYPSLKEIILLPLYPHYAMSSYETAVVYAEEVLKKSGFPFRLKIIPSFYNEERYLEAQAESIRPYLEQEYDTILFSFHGIPERHIRKSDITGNHCLQSANCCEIDSPAHQHCYRHQCRVTTKLVAAKLGIPENKYDISFQSRLGRDKWLEPSTVATLKAMPARGTKRLLIVCPAFVSDCLETLEEIAIEGKHLFMEAGGESFTLIPCMNVHPKWVSAVASYIRQETLVLA